MMQASPPSIPLPLRKRPSIRGILLRELIAIGVKAAGGDIIALGKKQVPTSVWQPPKGWQLEKFSLPDGAYAQ